MKRAVRTVVVIMICAVIMVSYYVYLDRSTSKRADNSDNVKVTEKDRLLDMDFNDNYPPTPREVIKLYNRYLAYCFGDNKLSRSEQKKMADNIRELMDSELASDNPKEQYEDSFAGEISDFQSRKAKIVSTSVCDTSDVIYGKKNGKQIAYVKTSYFIREASSYSTVYQMYVLRLDSASHWKVLGFHLTDVDGNTISDGHKISAGTKTE